MPRPNSWLSLLFSSTFACGALPQPQAPLPDGSAEVLASNQATPRGLQISALLHAAALVPFSSQGAIDPASSAAQNADAIAAQLPSKIGGCANAKVRHDAGSVVLSVDLGGGCVIAGYGTLSGVFTLVVSKDATLRLGFAIASLSINGAALNGSLSAATADGKSFSLVTEVTAQGSTIKGGGTITLDEDTKGLGLSSSGVITGPGKTVPYTAAGLHRALGGCYAEAGTVTISEMVSEKLGPPLTVQVVLTFLPSTPQSGQLTVTIADQTAPATLPPYGDCPK